MLQLTRVELTQDIEPIVKEIIKPNEEFFIFLEDNGIKFNENFEPILTKPLFEVKNSLSNAISSMKPERKRNIIVTINQYLSNQDYLEKWLYSPNEIMPSLVRILLSCPELQDDITSILIQFFIQSEFADNIPRLRKLTFQIVRDLSFLTKVSNQEEFADQLFEAISRCHPSIKQILFQYLFQLLDNIDLVIDRILNFMIESFDLIPDILGSLEGFPLSTENKQRVRKHVLNNILPAISTKDLPSVIRFLISTTDETNSYSTVCSFRENLFVISNNNFEIDTLTADDSNFFLLVQLKNALQFNIHFFKSYLTILEQSETEFSVVDIWVIFCIFSIPSQRNKAQTLIQKTIGKTLTQSSIEGAINGHYKSIECIITSIIDLMSWMISSNTEIIIEYGIIISKLIFNEVNDIGILQDIIGTFLIQIEIGEEINKEKIANALEILALENPEKLKYHSQLIQGILWSQSSLKLSIYQKITKVVSNLTFRTINDINEQIDSQLHIGYSKMLSSSKQEIKEYGVIGFASIIDRYNEILQTDFTPLENMFLFVTKNIKEDKTSLLLFFKTLLENKERSKSFNKFLVKYLSEQINYILFEDENGEKFINFNLFFDHKNQKSHKRYSLQKVRKILNQKISSLIFSSYGTQLLFDSYLSLGKNLRIKCKDYFEISIKLNNEIPLNLIETITILHLSHCYLSNILNYFCDIIDDNYIKHYETLIQIEDLLIKNLQEEEENYLHPIYGDIFPKYHTYIKRLIKDNVEDISALFYEKYRTSFIPPEEQIFKLLTQIEFPLTDIHKRILFRLIINYKYIITTIPKNSIFPPNIFYSTEVPNILIKYILPNVKDNELISQYIFDILRLQINLPIYKDKVKFNELLMSYCDSESRIKCFKYFYNYLIKNDFQQNVKISIILLLRSILHCGPPIKIDLQSNECKNLCQCSKDLLTSANPILDKKGVKAILPIFFEHNKSILKDVTTFITDTFKCNFYNGERNEEWISLNDETFPIFYWKCFVLLNHKILEVKKKIQSNSFVISEEIVGIIMNRLNKLSALMKGLILQACKEEVPLCILKITVQKSVIWIDASIGLFQFLNDAKFCDVQSVGNFLELSKEIMKYLQNIVDHIRRNEKSLQSTLPSLSKAIAQWKYSLKSTIELDENGKISGEEK